MRTLAHTLGISPQTLYTTLRLAEHVFRCLRRYIHQMDHFGTKDATQRF